jgi:hypothetical protein
MAKMRGLVYSEPNCWIPNHDFEVQCYTCKTISSVADGATPGVWNPTDIFTPLQNDGGFVRAPNFPGEGVGYVNETRFAFYCNNCNNNRFLPAIIGDEALGNFRRRDVTVLAACTTDKTKLYQVDELTLNKNRLQLLDPRIYKGYEYSPLLLPIYRCAGVVAPFDDALNIGTRYILKEHAVTLLSGAKEHVQQALKVGFTTTDGGTKLFLYSTIVELRNAILQDTLYINNGNLAISNKRDTKFLKCLHFETFLDNYCLGIPEDEELEDDESWDIQLDRPVLFSDVLAILNAHISSRNKIPLSPERILHLVTHQVKNLLLNTPPDILNELVSCWFSVLGSNGAVSINAKHSRMANFFINYVPTVANEANQGNADVRQ